MARLFELLEQNGPALLSVAIAVAMSMLGLMLAYWLLFARELGTLRKLSRQIAMLMLTLIAIFSTVLVLSGFEGTKDTAAVLVGLLGLVLSVAITVSSTTFMSNAMAGLMLRAVRNFRTGDFVRVAGYFGRVTERGLFHVEIQTEDRDLATLPNMYLVSQPVKVVRASGTIVSTELSLGYDVPHDQIESLLQRAALAAGLEKPFVYLLKLGDYSITYQIAGFLPKVEHLLSARSALRASVLDTLHGADIEIVSPAFMNQRRLPEDAVVLPEQTPAPTIPPRPDAPAPEDIMFDKANREQDLESLRTEQESLGQEIKDLEHKLPKADQDERLGLESEIERLRQRSESIEAALREAAEQQHADGTERAT